MNFLKKGLTGGEGFPYIRPTDGGSASWRVGWLWPGIDVFETLSERRGREFVGSFCFRGRPGGERVGRLGSDRLCAARGVGRGLSGPGGGEPPKAV